MSEEGKTKKLASALSGILCFASCLPSGKASFLLPENRVVYSVIWGRPRWRKINRKREREERGTVTRERRQERWKPELEPGPSSPEKSLQGKLKSVPLELSIGDEPCEEHCKTEKPSGKSSGKPFRTFREPSGTRCFSHIKNSMFIVRLSKNKYG
jgi:hypothetical protein